jgi:signal transduction histidine kinase
MIWSEWMEHFPGVRQRLRLSGPLAENLTARILYALLIGLLAWTVSFAAVFLPFLSPRPLAATIVLSLQAVVLATSLILVNRGALRLASTIFLAARWTIATATIILNGGIHCTGLIFYVAIPVSAAWLFGSGAALLSALVCLGTALALAILETVGIRMPFYFPGTPFGILGPLVEATITGVVPVMVVLRHLREALKAAKTDVSELKRNQEKMLAAQKMESIVALIAGITHHVNNQMATIILEAEQALSDIPAGSPEHDNVKRISAVASRVCETVELLRTYDESKLASAVTAVDLSHVVDETLGLFRVTVTGRAGFRVELARDLPCIQADESLMRQMVMNLLNNAWESLQGKKGLIQVTTSLVSLEKSDGGDGANPPAGDYVRLEVADNGSGIEKENLTRLFDPFYTTKSLGRGLGLPAVQGIVRSLEGYVRIQSAPGHGTTFEILIPFAEKPGRGAARRAADVLSRRRLRD